jgi:hypothetical protein
VSSWRHINVQSPAWLELYVARMVCRGDGTRLMCGFVASVAVAGSPLCWRSSS